MNSTSDTERELEDTRAALENVKREFETFAHIVSHDLNAPLRHIDAFSRRLGDRLNGSLDEESQEELDIILSSTEKCKRLLSILLEYSRLSTNKDELVNVDIRELVDNVIDALATRFDMSKARIVVSTLPKINGKYGHLFALFTYLFDNALRYQKADSAVEISLSANEEAEHWHFILQDNGIGIPSKCLEDVFTLFKRAVAGDTYQGDGSGLTLARRIVDLHGGKIWLLSEEGLGTQVHVCLPRT